MKRYCFVLALLALSFQQTIAQGVNETAIRNFFAAIDAGNFDQAARYLSPDLQVHLPLSPEPLNLEAYKQLGMGFKAGFPDIRHQILEVVENGNTAGFKGWFSGTNTGSLMGNPPSNNKVSLPFIGYFKFDATGKIIEINSQFDLARFNAQLMGNTDSNK